MRDSVAPRFAEHFQRLEALVSAEISSSMAGPERKEGARQFVDVAVMPSSVLAEATNSAKADD